MVNGEGPMGMDKLYLTKDQLSTFSSMITVRISKWTHPVVVTLFWSRIVNTLFAYIVW